MSRFAKMLFLVVLAGLLLSLLTDYVQACPNCKDALSQNDPARSGLARGFFWSIMLMLATPFLITVGLGSYFYLLVRKARISGNGYVHPALAISQPRELAGTVASGIPD